MKFTAEDLANLAEDYTQLRLNATKPDDVRTAEIMCELIRLAQLGAALAETSKIVVHQ